MTRIDPQTDAALEQLHRQWSPPPGNTEAMLAAFHQRLGEGGDEGGGPEGGGESIGLAEPIARLGYVVKIVAATVGMTTAGLATLWMIGEATREPRAKSSSSVVIVDEPRSLREPPEIEPRESTPTIIVPAPTLDAPAITPRRSPSSASGSSEPAAIDLAAELALIRAAEAATPSEALDLLATHAERFPSGTLASEREGLWILTLCELGRTNEAETRASRFVVEYPSSLMAERIANACSTLEKTTTDSVASGHGLER